MEPFCYRKKHLYIGNIPVYIVTTAHTEEAQAYAGKGVARKTETLPADARTAQEEPLRTNGAISVTSSGAPPSGRLGD